MQYPEIAKDAGCSADSWFNGLKLSQFLFRKIKIDDPILLKYKNKAKFSEKCAFLLLLPFPLVIFTIYLIDIINR